MKPAESQTTAWRIVARAVPVGKVASADILEALNKWALEDDNAHCGPMRTGRSSTWLHRNATRERQKSTGRKTKSTTSKGSKRVAKPLGPTGIAGFAAAAEFDMMAHLVARYFGLTHYGKIYGVQYAVFFCGAAAATLSVAALSAIGGLTAVQCD